MWQRTRLAVWTAQPAVIVDGEFAPVITRSQMAVANWRNNQVPDQSIDCSQCLLYTASVRAVGNVQFCGNLLMRQLNQAVAMGFLT